VDVAEHVPVPYDLLSINVGITPDLSGIDGAAEHGVPIKPIAGLLARLSHAQAAVRALDRPAKLAIIGGGAAGIELAIAMHDRNRRLARFASHITLVAGGGLAPALNVSAQRRVRQRLGALGIAVVEGDRAVAIRPGEVQLASGAVLGADVAFVSTQAQLPAWLAAQDAFLVSNGGLAVRPTLQLEGDDRIFAAGDCATMVQSPRARAGVYAVRQGPVLARNLRAAAMGRTLKAYHPQDSHLVLLRTGHDEAIGARGRFLCAQGRWLWWLKDRIDRRFVNCFKAAAE
jgi:NADH dehydrogenase FAD-containing subunit